MSRLVLIDGNAILHRAFHALPPMRNSKGNPTNAIYGFVAMLLRVIEELKPEYLSVTFDRPKPTFRNELYKEYQAHRPKMDDSLAQQVSGVHEIVAALGIPIYEKDGYEADDVIGTIAREVEKNKKVDEVIIVTGDRDLLQLVDKKIKLFMPVKGLSEAKIYGEKEAEERLGVPPEKVVALKALMGDPSDNYPGVAGIGPKTATTLLKQFSSISELVANIDKIKDAKVRDKINNDKENLLISQKLATVVTDAPVEFDLKTAKIPDDFLTPKVVEAFGKFEFRTLLKRLSKMNGKDISVKPAKKKEKPKTQDQQMGLF